MGKKFNAIEILEIIDSHLINFLSKNQLNILILLIATARKNNGSGKLEPETIKNLAGEYFNGEDLFVICQILKRFGWGELACCKEENPRNPPCLTENWQNLNIGVEFFGIQKPDRKER